MRRVIGVSVSLVLAGLVVLVAEERPDEAMFWKIRQEASSRSQILGTLHMFTDVYGPRVTGSPNLKAAGEWAVQQMTSWGLKNAHLEPWDFGAPGWANERFTAHITSPVKDALVAEVLAWTPSTNGVARGQAMQITLPVRPTQADLTSYLETVKPSIKGKIVLVGSHQQVPVTFNPVSLRREDADVLAQLNNPPAQAQGPAVAPPQPSSGTPPAPRPLTNGQIQEQLNQFLVANGALVRINDAGRDHGQIRAFDNATRDTSKAPPTVVMRNEDYGRISRLLADKRQVELEFEIVNRSYPEGRTSYNTIAEIPGSDKADEVVMLGGHLDSWHAATGATDNAIGCSVMMEAVRISQRHRRPAAADDPRGAVERRGAGVAGLEGLCPPALRDVRRSEAGVREAVGIHQHGLWHRTRARPDRVRPGGHGRMCCAKPRHRSRISACSARQRRGRGPLPGPTRPTSTRRVCQASTPFSIRFSTRPTPGTPTSTPTSASSRTM